jgi:hypothetical protein
MLPYRWALIEFDCPPDDLEAQPEFVVHRKSTHDPRPAEERMTYLAGILTDLDRCEHGRHEGDDCNQCGGPSTGNPIPEDDRIIGYDISGRSIVVPKRGEKWAYWRDEQAVVDAVTDADPSS